MSSFRDRTWSHGRQLLWINSPIGKHLDLAFEVSRKASYDVKLRLTTAYDFGIVRFQIDDQPLGEPVDLFRAGREGDASTIEVSLGIHELAAHAHRIRVHLVGSHRDARPKHGFGIDYIQFTEQK